MIETTLVEYTEAKFERSGLRTTFDSFSRAIQSGQIQAAKLELTAFQNQVTNILQDAYPEFGEHPRFKGEIDKVEAWMRTATESGNATNSEVEQYGYFLSHAFKWATKPLKGDGAKG